MNRLRIRAVSILCVTLLASSLTATPIHASSDDLCSFGYTSTETYDDPVNWDVASIKCTLTNWNFKTKSDGFSKTTVMSMPEDLAGMPSGTAYNQLYFVVRCELKKLEAYFSSAEIKILENSNWPEKLLYKVDSGKILSTTFRASSDETGFFVNSPAKFLANVIKGKNKISIKYENNQGWQVSQFPLSDMAKYRSKFSSVGCKF